MRGSTPIRSTLRILPALGLLLLVGPRLADAAEPGGRLGARASLASDVSTALHAVRETCAGATCGFERHVPVLAASWTLVVVDLDLHGGDRPWVREAGGPEPRSLDGVWIRDADCGANGTVPLGADPGLQVVF